MSIDPITSNFVLDWKKQIQTIFIFDRRLSGQNSSIGALLFDALTLSENRNIIELLSDAESALVKLDLLRVSDQTTSWVIFDSSVPAGEILTFFRVLEKEHVAPRTMLLTTRESYKGYQEILFDVILYKPFQMKEIIAQINKEDSF